MIINIYFGEIHQCEEFILTVDCVVGWRHLSQRTTRIWQLLCKVSVDLLRGENGWLSRLCLVPAFFLRDFIPHQDWRVSTSWHQSQRIHKKIIFGVRDLSDEQYQMFSLNQPTGPIQSYSYNFCPFVCFCVCLWRLETPSSGGLGDLCLKNIFHILGCDDTI